MGAGPTLADGRRENPAEDHRTRAGGGRARAQGERSRLKGSTTRRGHQVTAPDPQKTSRRCPSPPPACAYFIRGDEAVSKPKRRMPRLSYDRTIAPSHTALALELVTEMDLLRLKSIARLYARGLPPDVAWDDLLQEAITRVLTGKRVRPD